MSLIPRNADHTDNCSSAILQIFYQLYLQPDCKPGTSFRQSHSLTKSNQIKFKTKVCIFQKLNQNSSVIHIHNWREAMILLHDNVLDTDTL